MSVRTLMIFVVAGWLAVGQAAADELLYRYECNVAPYDYDDPEDEYDAWIIANACEDPCVDCLEDGHYVLRWSQGADLVNYSLALAEPPEDPPASLWVEWRFRSNHPLGPYFYNCDGSLVVRYGGMLEVVNMYGDAAISFSGDDAVFGLNLAELHTYRFESLDGINYHVAVDGQVFIVRAEDKPSDVHFIQFGGDGGCDVFPNTTNEWDYIRFGTISSGEQIVASDPPSGIVSTTEYPDLDRFTVTFDSPNYVYIHDITVTVTGGEVPVVRQTRRRENDGPETVEIVLDRPIAVGETTTFEFNTAAPGSVIAYDYRVVPQIPTIPTCGLVLAGLLLLASGTIIFGKPRARPGPA